MISKGTRVLEDARLIDGTGHVREQATIRIEGERIAGVADATEVGSFREPDPVAAW